MKLQKVDLNLMRFSRFNNKLTLHGHMSHGVGLPQTIPVSLPEMGVVKTGILQNGMERRNI